MTQRSHQPEPLPFDAGTEERRIDEALGRLAAAQPVPAGLAQRVFFASAPRLGRSGSIWSQYRSMGRLAMAAALLGAFAFIVTLPPRDNDVLWGTSLAGDSAVDKALGEFNRKLDLYHFSASEIVVDTSIVADLSDLEGAL